MVANTVCADLDKDLILFKMLQVGLCESLYLRCTIGSTQRCHSSLVSFPFHHRHLPRVKNHNASFVSSPLCICLSHECSFMFDCSEQLFCSSVMLTGTSNLVSMKAEVSACRFQREPKRVWIVFISDYTMRKISNGRNIKLNPSWIFWSDSLFYKSSVLVKKNKKIKRYPNSISAFL